MEKIYVVQYAHKSDAFDGWYTICATDNKAHALSIEIKEKAKEPGYWYQVKAVPFVEA